MSPPRVGLLRFLILLAVAMAGRTTPLAAQVAAPPITPAPTSPPPVAAPSALGRTAGIADTIKESFKEADQAIVRAFANDQTTQLAGNDLSAQSTAREALISEASIPGNPQKVSASYLDAYAGAVNDALAPLAKNANPRIRLNAAIVAAKVATLADNTRLADTTMLLLADKSDAVALWAMKAAHAVLPALLRASGAVPPNGIVDPKSPSGRMLMAIVPTVQAHPTGAVAGSIAEEGYGALSLDILDPNKRRKLTDPMLKAALPEILRLLEVRTNLYVNGLPPHPFAEHLPAGFLSQGQVIALETPAQKLASMQLLSNLIGLIAQQVGNVGNAGIQELTTMIQRAAAAISVANANNPAIVAAVGPASQLNAKANAAAIAQAVAPIVAALKAVYPELKDPPAIVAPAQPAPDDLTTTGPTTAPTSRAAK